MNKGELSMADLREAVARYNRPLRDRVLDALANGKGLTKAAIAERAFSVVTSVGSVIQPMLRSGLVKRVKVGKTTFYYREGVADAAAVVGRRGPSGRSGRRTVGR